MPPEDPTPSNLAAAVQDISERASVLVREEIELAKAEITEKATSLAKGVVVGLAAGIFVSVGLLFLLHGLAWLIDDLFFDSIFWGFFIVAGALFILGGLAGFIASRAMKSGAPPTPDMAIDEAKRIKATVDEARHPAPAPASGTVPVSGIAPEPGGTS